VAVLHGEPLRGPAHLPYCLETATVASAAYGLGALVLAFALAAASLWYDRLPRPVLRRAGLVVWPGVRDGAPLVETDSARRPLNQEMTLSDDKIARNQATFRALNDEIETAVRRFQIARTEPVRFLCECGDRDCLAAVAVPLAVYERVRWDSHFFLVAPGHVFGGVERTIEETDAYAIVEKTSRPTRRIADQSDPAA
jgi:hypothetical protein